MLKIHAMSILVIESVRAYAPSALDLLDGIMIDLLFFFFYPARIERLGCIVALIYHESAASGKPFTNRLPRRWSHGPAVTYVRLWAVVGHDARGR
jgi:hypothetical protein